MLSTMRTTIMMILAAMLALAGCSDRPDICPAKKERSLKYRACPGGDSCEEGTACWNGFCAEMCDLSVEGACAGARETCIRPYESTPIGVCLESCLETTSSEYLDNDFAACSMGDGEAVPLYWSYDYADVCG